MRIDSIYTGNVSTGAMKSMGITQASTKRQKLAKKAEQAAMDLRNMKK